MGECKGRGQAAKDDTVGASTHSSEIPSAQSPACKCWEMNQGAGILRPIPLWPRASDAIITSASPSALTVLPAFSSQHVHSHLALESPRALPPRPPSCLSVLALLGRCFPADCPWGKGEGSSAKSGRSQVEGAGGGRRAGFPTSTSRCWRGGSAFPAHSLLFLLP